MPDKRILRRMDLTSIVSLHVITAAVFGTRRSTEMPEAPFGLVTYLAPSERRSVIYANESDVDGWPAELEVKIAYTDEDGKTPQQLLKEGLRGPKGIVDGAVQQVTEANASSG